MNPQLMTKQEFYDKYWFSPLQMVTLINPKAEDYRFMVEMRPLVIRAGVKEEMPGTVANVYLNQMTRIMAQDDDKMQFLSDFNLMKVYYDKLIVDVKNLMPEANLQPTYLQHVPERMKENIPETPPWTAATAPLSNELREKPAEGTKEFELNGLTFKSVTDPDGKTEFFKNNTSISEADYAKAASMV